MNVSKNIYASQSRPVGRPAIAVGGVIPCNCRAANRQLVDNSTMMVDVPPPMDGAVVRGGDGRGKGMVPAPASQTA